MRTFTPATLPVREALCARWDQVEKQFRAESDPAKQERLGRRLYVLAVGIDSRTPKTPEQSAALGPGW